MATGKQKDVYGFLSVANCLFCWKPQLCKLCCHHTLQATWVGWFALSLGLAHRFLTSPELHKWYRRGKIPRLLPLWAAQGSFFCWGILAVMAPVQSVTGWLHLMTRGTTDPLSWLPIPRKCTPAWLLLSKESHMYSGNLLFINLTCAQRAAAETDFFNQIMHFQLNDLVSTHFLFLSCCTGAICV